MKYLLSCGSASLSLTSLLCCFNTNMFQYTVLEMCKMNCTP